MLYRLETVEVRRTQAAELEGNEITIDMIKNEWTRARYVGFESSLFFNAQAVYSPRTNLFPLDKWSFILSEETGSAVALPVLLTLHTVNPLLLRGIRLLLPTIL